VRKTLLLLATSSLMLALPVQAQADGNSPEVILRHELREGVITVLANGERSYAGNNGLPLTVFEREEIEALQGPDIARLLERVPGVTISRNGGQGSLAGLRLRGAEADQLLVLRDGVPVMDVAAPGGGFDLSAVLPASLGKVELLRSSNSTIWGSQAIGGILSLESPRDRDGLAAGIEYGGPESIYSHALAGLAGERGSLALHGSFLDSSGISAVAGGREADGVRQWALGSTGALDLAPGLQLRASGDFGRARLEIDGFPAPAYRLADTDEVQESRTVSASGTLAYVSREFDLRGSFGLSDTQRENFDSASAAAANYSTRGWIERADLRGAWRPVSDWSLHFGGERQWSRMETLFDPRRATASGAVYAQIGHAGERLVLNAGLRLDHHRDFGRHWSFGTDGAIRLGDGWRLRGSWGEGFKAPTLFQLHSDYGNAALRPERSRSMDAGIAYDGAVIAAQLSLFRRDSEELIGFVSCSGAGGGICAERPFGTYDNIGKARAQGVELEFDWEVAADVRLTAAYAYVEAEDHTPGAASRGNDLARRPRHAGSATLAWTEPQSGLALAADLRVVSASFDDAANLVRMAGHALGTIRASLPLIAGTELFGRVENLWDENYETAAGYGTAGRTGHVGVRSAF